MTEISNNKAAKIPEFDDIVTKLPDIGYSWHKDTLINNAAANKPFINNSIRKLSPVTGAKKESCILISAGPSVSKQNSINKIYDSQYSGTTIAVDGTYAACLKAGLYPDYVVTMDPNSNRVVRWFGDPDFEKHSLNDDYYLRQDLDVDFRNKSSNHNDEVIELVNRYANKTKLIIASTAACTVRDRVLSAKFKDILWYNPLVDDPNQDNSLTKKLWELNNLPCINTGGTVGTVSWVIAATHFKIITIGLVGMDFGYHYKTPFSKTQTYYEIIDYVGADNIDLKKYFRYTKFPTTGESYYADPTYHWYKNNFIELVNKVGGIDTYNCTDGGTLVHDIIKTMSLNEYLIHVKQ